MNPSSGPCCFPRDPCARASVLQLRQCAAGWFDCHRQAAQSRRARACCDKCTCKAPTPSHTSCLEQCTAHLITAPRHGCVAASHAPLPTAASDSARPCNSNRCGPWGCSSVGAQRNARSHIAAKKQRPPEVLLKQLIDSPKPTTLHTCATSNPRARVTLPCGRHPT
jgi:hypothetical protein